MRHGTLITLRKSKTFIVMLIVIMCTIIYPKSVRAEESKIIRVGFPSVSGFTEKKDGGYTGYAYEYLREISIYTGWQYEFVEKNLEELLEDLRNGEIDILAGMLKNEATMQIYDFPKYDSGMTYTTLAVLDNNSFDESKYIILDGMKVGYLEKNVNGPNVFKEFCEENKIKDIDLISYSSGNGRPFLLEKMKDGEVDAIIGGDLTVDSNENVIAKFGGKPHYFATTKGNSEVIEGLNRAIYKIKDDNPYFDQTLYSKYFVNNYNNNLVMTKDEVNYIKHMNSIRAAYVDGLMPIQYYDEDTNQPKGIFVDAMNLISERAGIKFDYVRAKTYNEAYEMMRDGQIDIIIGAVNDYSIADKYDFMLTKVYLDYEVLKVVNNERNNNEVKEIIALPIGHDPLNLTGEYEIKYYNNMEECLRAVDEGIATSTYGNSYSISNYSAVGYYNNIKVIYTGDESEIAVGISNKIDSYARDILNKAVYSLSDKDIENIAQKNTLNIKHSISIKDFFYTNLVLCLSIISIVLIIIFALIYIIFKMRFNKIKEDKQRLFEKTQIDSLTGVYNREACEKLVMEYLNEKDVSLYCAFIIIDIDYFKQINDRLGHKVGDDLLVDFSKILKESFSNKDIISRLGGDEFIVFIKDIEENNIRSIEETLKKVCKLMDKEIEYNDINQRISLSLGCVMTKFKMNFNKLYTIADETLYEVKRNGKNGYKIKKLN
ncbi:GGDEF domain-containing protein [Clostridium sartagoforme]|uniref:GGDEF domain-containing protein n=1 Tax=Clostridium sartagoforme TaxID=84031 RepID=A0A4S2DPB1_9CLOT|nr:GGDEF domain-containing protein [Clostridium sartagoforme]TGY44248.1 GGDEF domain-containing protein [Clostridium sartagoforme]